MYVILEIIIIIIIIIIIFLAALGLRCSVQAFSFLFKINLFINFYFLAVLGLCCCMRAFSSCDERGYSSLQCVGFSLRWFFSCFGAWALGTWASVVVACGLSSSSSWALEHGLSSCGAQA